MFCQVIVDIAHEDVDRVFTYRVPRGMQLCPGMRVHVPFGRQKKIEGVVVELVEDCDLPPERVKDVTDMLEDYPLYCLRCWRWPRRSRRPPSARWRRRCASCIRRRCAASGSAQRQRNMLC